MGESVWGQVTYCITATFSLSAFNLSAFSHYLRITILKAINYILTEHFSLEFPMNISLEQLKEAAIEIISKGSSDKGQERSGHQAIYPRVG